MSIGRRSDQEGLKSKNGGNGDWGLDLGRAGGWGLGRDLSSDGSLFLCRRICLCCRIRTVAPWIPAATLASLVGSLGKDPMEAP